MRRNTDLLSKLSRVKSEYEIWRHADDSMPSDLSSRHLDILCKMETARERITYLTRIGRQERSKQNFLDEREQKMEEYATLRKIIKEDRLNNAESTYALGANFILQRLQKQQYKRWFFQRMAAAAPTTKFTIVHDFSLLNRCYVGDQQRSIVNAQLAFMRNACHRSPANLIYTSMDKKSYWYQNFVPHTYQPNGIDEYPVHKCTEKHFTDLYPVEKLVYLTPDSSHLLNDIDEDRVYVIGAVNDIRRRIPLLTLGEAKRWGITTARFPIDRYVKWGRGSKHFQISQAHGMLLDYFLTKNWKTAFENNISNWNLERIQQDPIEAKIQKVERIEYAGQRMLFLLSLVDKGDEFGS
uniref:SAM-dependent MTase TRM10-type domain-containing protein n=1 Tax=Romanomermis culicivorax TaxID=13658 RepID=A0A915ISG2_ROMCU